MATIFNFMNDNQQFLTDNKEAVEVFSINSSDHEITSVLRNRIAKSEAYFERAPYSLSKTRKMNHELLWGDAYRAGNNYPTLYNSSVKYTEPQIYVGIQTIISYLTGKIHEVESRPFNDTTAGQLIAKDFAKYAEAHGIQFGLIGLLTNVLFDLMEKRVGVIKLTWDPNYNKIGEIIPKHIDPARIVFDHTARRDDNPGFIAEKVNASVQDLLQKFPEKKEEIFEHFNIRAKQPTGNQLSARGDYFETWVTGQNKDGKPEEQLMCFIGGCVLAKSKNPHYLYDVEEEYISNAAPFPPKPYITINLLNDGSSKIDQNSLIEMVANMQHTLNRRKRTIAESAEHYAGLKVWAGDAVDKNDVEDLSGEPDESIVVDGEDVSKAVQKIAPDQLPQYVYQDAADIREQIHAVLGTPPNLRGTESNTETLGEAVMQRDQAEGRMTLLVRALDKFMDQYYAMLYQFVKVYYTEEHWQALAGENGQYDHVMMHRDRIKDGLDVRAKGGSNIPDDDDRLANIGMKLANMDRISTNELYKLLKLPKAEQMFESYVKEKVDPTLLVTNLQQAEGERTAEMDFEIIRAGQDAPAREDPKADHIETHRLQMVRDEYITGKDEDGKLIWTPEKKAAMEAHVTAEIESLRRRAIAMEDKLAANDQAKQNPMLPGSGNVAPDPSIAPTPPGMPPAMPGAPGQPPAPQGGGQPPAPATPPQAPPPQM